MAGRIKVVFASLLKPVDEPRMYEKLGRSLAQTYKYDVNIIGFSSKNLPKDPTITFWPLFDFKRISLGRLVAPLRYFKKLIQLKPEVIIATGTDMMTVSVLYKILFGCYLINDLQENYYRNIIWSHHKPSLFSRIRAGFIRLQEIVLDRMIIQYILAERCYVNECSFIIKPALVLENKALKPGIEPTKKTASSLHLVYTGTIAESYGIFDAIHLVDTVQQVQPNTIFTICGHCPLAKVYQQLTALAKHRPWVKLQISRTPLPHTTILEVLGKADFTLVAYRLNPANKDCIPTRIWEALAWQTPMILRREHPWVTIADQHMAGFSIDYANPDIEYLKAKLFQTKYYTQPLPENIYWESCEKEWISLIDKIVAING